MYAVHASSSSSLETRRACAFQLLLSPVRLEWRLRCGAARVGVHDSSSERRRGHGNEVCRVKSRKSVRVPVRMVDAGHGGASSSATAAQNERSPDSALAGEKRQDAALGEQNALVDVIVVGGGPAGLSLAAQLGMQSKANENASRGDRPKIMLVDATLDQRWVPNYGVWVDEFETTGYKECVRNVWPRTSVYLSPDGSKKVLDRPYARVDTVKLKQAMLARCAESGVVLQQAHVKAVDSSTNDGSVSSVDFIDGVTGKVHTVNARLVVDSTGHALSGRIEFQTEHDPGYQGAYGIECDVTSHPFALDEMLLMDFRSDHMKSSPEDIAEAEKVPLFVYVMPSSPTRIFVEETSLVARPAVPFDYLKRQLYKRLTHYGVHVERVIEEEFCLIPMGGALPKLDQAVLGYGGAAGFVHPATGYSLTRSLNATNMTASSILDALSRTDVSLSSLSARLWSEAVWTRERLLQREFLIFGGEFLMTLQLSEIRSFFSAFFELPMPLWSAYLAFGLLKPSERIQYGLRMFLLMDAQSKLAIAQAATIGPHAAHLWRSINPIMTK